ncbi:acyl carrier protein, partial [Streptomyces sp. WAC06614]|uniref:acyl carrier protein n=1 Tax=Streptomyces sp. WAC06614 TaxID=2487416 RepID=UPI000F9CBD0B
ARVAGVAAVGEVLREQLAAVLCCDVWEIDPAEPFARMGVDSLRGAEFVAAVNRVFGLRERSVVLYDQPCLRELAVYVAARAGGTLVAPLGRIG